MSEINYRDTAWRATLMGSEGWAVFAGPKMLASHLTEEHARLIAAAPELVKALKQVLADDRGPSGRIRFRTIYKVEQAIRKTGDNNAS